MKSSFRNISGSICAPRGFQCAAVFCDIKRLGTGKGSEKGRKDDLALIVSDVPAAVAGMFTTNQVCAAPVRVCRQIVAKGFVRGIVVNSGNANAATGRQGMIDAKQMSRIAGLSIRAVRKLDGLKPSSLREREKEEIMVCSTGRIGVPMPMKNVERGISECAPLLTRSTASARKVAEAIMTSDTRRKEIAVECTIDNRVVRIGGICKGAGMIQPLMKHATMLGFITSDIAIDSQTLKRALGIAVDQSFNRITVDGDMSTNDSVIVLANGLAGNRALTENAPRRLDGFKPSSLRGGSGLGIFQSALNHVCLELAKMIVRDGEGVSRFVTVRVRGARNNADAEAAARAIANSSLVRTSWCGGDPNWGRILCAIGYSKAKIDESKVDIGYSKPNNRQTLFGFRNGRPANVSFGKLTAITSAKEFDIQVDLKSGRGEFVMYASDLTEDYVTFNKGDVTDPTTLGG